MRYTLESHQHGWLLVAPRGHRGVPMTALSEIAWMTPSDAIIHHGIAHHFVASGRPEVCMAMARPSAAAQWCAEIEESLRHLPPTAQWWRGTDVGLSSAAIFAVFAEGRDREAAAEISQGAVPRDAADLGRCLRLLAKFPEWRAQLDRVATAYPKTEWPVLITRWAELEKSGWSAA